MSKKLIINTLFFFTLLVPQAFAYQLKWVSQPAIVKEQDGTKVKFQQISGMILSEYFPTKKAVSIINIEVKNPKLNDDEKCDKDFFPHQVIKLKNPTQTKVKGVNVVYGFWPEEFKYVIFTCTNTAKGFRTSNASIRMPFTKAATKQTYMIQIEHAIQFFSKPENKKTSYLNKFKDIFYNFNFIELAMGIPPSAPSTTGLETQLDNLNNNVSDTNKNLSDLNATIGTESSAWRGESGKWQTESQAWQKEVSKLRDAFSTGLEKGDEWVGKLTKESEAWREQLATSQEWADKMLSNKNLFGMAFSTAAGAALGGFGVNLALKGITTGIEALINKGKVKKENYAKLSNALYGENGQGGLRKEYYDMEKKIDQLILALPVMAIFGGKDSYEALEIALSQDTAAKKKTLASSRKKLDEILQPLQDKADIYALEGNREKQNYYEACMRKDYRSINLANLDFEIKSSERILAFMKAQEDKKNKMRAGIGSHLNLDSFCNNIRDLIKDWRELEARFVQAEAIFLQDGKIEGKAVKEQFNHMKHLLDPNRIKKKGEDSLDYTEKTANKILNEAVKQMGAEYKKNDFGNRKSKKSFDKEYENCSLNWCRGMYTKSSGVACSQLIGELEPIPVDALFESLWRKDNTYFEQSPIYEGKPGDKFALLAAKGIIKRYFVETHTGGTSKHKVERQRVLRVIENKHGRKCFNHNFDKHFKKVLTGPEKCEEKDENKCPIDYKIRCSEKDYKKVGSFEDLAKCGEDYKRLKKIHTNVVVNIGAARRDLAKVGKIGKSSTAHTEEALRKLERKSKRDAEAARVLSGLPLDLKNQNKFDQYCKQK